MAFLNKVLLGERHGHKVDNVLPTKAGLRTVVEVLNIQKIFWPKLESILSNLLSVWGVHLQEKSECSSHCHNMFFF